MYIHQSIGDRNKAEKCLSLYQRDKRGTVYKRSFYKTEETILNIIYIRVHISII